MLPFEFFAQNLNFVLNLLFSLVLFAIFWLYLDAWLLKKKLNNLLKPFGFLLLSISFLLQAVQIETEFLGESVFGQVPVNLVFILRLISYLVLIIALVREPLQKKPETKGLSLESNKAIFPLFVTGVSLVNPLTALGVALLFYRKASKGLEAHLNKIAFGFFFLSLFESVAAVRLLENSTDISISQLSSAFGPLWILSRALLFVALLFLVIWLWSYLVKRIQSQLFLVFTSAVVIVFVILSVSFTFLLSQNVQRQNLDNLEISSKVFAYALSSKEDEVSSVAQLLSEKTDLISSVAIKDREGIKEALELIEANNETSVTVLASSGQVLYRLEDPDRYGDSLDSDPLVKKALSRQNDFNIVSKEGVLAPVLYLQTSRPLLQDDTVIGVVLVGFAISNNFVDSVKSATGLDSTIFAGNIRSATTFLTQDDKRWIGIKEEINQIKKQVLEEGKTYKGTVSVQNNDYLGVYLPIENVNKQVVGMLFTGKDQTLVLKDVGRSIELVFLVTVSLLLLSIVPVFFLSRYISRQLQ